MSEKVKVSRGVAESLEKAGENMDGHLEMIIESIAEGYKFTSKSFSPLNELSLSDILRIYKYGYEIEETPE